jgi:hypothetical protein
VELLQLSEKEWWFLVTGLTITTVGGWIVVWRILAAIRNRMPIPAISKVQDTQEKWQLLVAHPEESGKWVGVVERFVFFFGIIGATWQLIGVWLVFKLAAKWEAWSNMARIPERFDNVNHLDLALSRRVWAAQGYCTLVVGTALNFALAWLGVIVATEGPTLCSYLLSTPSD